jgi:deoxyuridine 5'-triphosphate nucleotidohydrolase
METTKLNDYIRSFDIIDTEEKAYSLGYFFVHTSKSHIEKSNDTPFNMKNTPLITRDMIISSFNKEKYQYYIQESYREVFFRGYFEALFCEYKSSDNVNYNELTQIYLKDNLFEGIHLNYTNLFTCIDFLGRLYKTSLQLKDSTYSGLYKLLNRIDKIKVIKKDSNAILPSKPNESDIGFDLTVIKKVKDLTENVELWDTGLVVLPPSGYYIEIVPRSSISKSGYMLANSVGIIDRGYRGTLMIALLKVSHSMNSIETPWKCCQMILRKHENSFIEECSDFEENTSRNTGGFGSSDK